jgi:hypothetical protein
MKKSILGFILVILALGSAVVASNYITPHMHDDESVVSHSGGTNSAGCHNDYIHGGYHCH